MGRSVELMPSAAPTVEPALDREVVALMHWRDRDVDEYDVSGDLELLAELRAGDRLEDTEAALI